MHEFMYGIDSTLISIMLFLSLVLAIEFGYRIGKHMQNEADEAFKAHINIIAAALLGILALLLGFTLSLSLQRYDQRSEAVVQEANAIGTTWLRVQMLPAPMQDAVRGQMRSYLDLRVQANAMEANDTAARAALVARVAQAQAALWSQAVKAAEVAPGPITSLFIQSLNEMIDSQGSRDAALARHVPEFVLLLLYVTFLLAGAIVGYTAGVAGHRASFVTYLMVALIVVLVFVILDLDRPSRGVIQVSQKSMTDLQASIKPAR